uniref:J domain-containing protein n=1 Tax=Meloidogyne enterolobii TaxID=390850 RepID=A0A6V7X939_MELEN|nr:unnamed protein product [Meloidogyne enterolobii]
MLKIRCFNNRKATNLFTNAISIFVETFQYHPDVSGSSDASNKKFVEISNAYETLKDEQKRREYDRQLRFGTSQERPSTGRETGQPPTWSTDFHPRPPFKNQEWEKEWKWQFGATSDRQRRRPFSPFDDIFGGPPPSGSSPFQRWQWDQEQKRRQWAEWEWGEEIERRKREEKELNEVGIIFFIKYTKTQDWDRMSSAALCGFRVTLLVLNIV